MNEHCAETCGVCIETCEDKHKECQGWASVAPAEEGEEEGSDASKAVSGCEANKAFMAKECPASCGTCQAMLQAAKEVNHDEL